MDISDLQRFLWFFIFAVMVISDLEIVEQQYGLSSTASFFPDHTLTCKFVSVYPRPLKRRKKIDGVDTEAVKE